MREVHADKPHVAAALAELSLVLVTVQGEFKALRTEFHQGFAKANHRIGVGALGRGNHKHAKGTPREFGKRMQNGNALLVVPNTEVVKAEKEFASHAMNIVNSS